uniref:Uncharacterized protein n=1 Tax=Schistosoma haematobium TaxID=6185 RepID=A0A095AQK7_SCHHA
MARRKIVDECLCYPSLLSVFRLWDDLRIAEEIRNPVHVTTVALNDLFPNMLNQWETAKLRLAKMNENSKTSDSKADDGDDDVPELVEDFDEKSRLE